MQTKNTFIVVSSAGPHRDLSRDRVNNHFGMSTESLLIIW